jgi:hypothetical protein
MAKKSAAVRAGSTAKAAATPAAPAKAMPGRRAGVLPQHAHSIGRSRNWNRRMPTAEVELRILILDADIANDTLVRDLLFASISSRNGYNAEGMVSSCGVGRDFIARRLESAQRASGQS